MTSSTRLWLAVSMIILLPGCENQNTNDKITTDDLRDISFCLTSESADIFEIMTWNLEQFPLSGKLTVNLVRQIIERQKPDLIAVQEISSAKDFEELANELEEYEGQLYIQGSLNTGFLYKSADITVTQALRPILSGDSFAWPRTPVIFSLIHKNGISADLIILHLKCCDGTENIERRFEASRQLKDYIDTNLPNEPVIVLGDFNDEIFGVPDSGIPFLNFINDPENYLFADMEIAQAKENVWSYPGWPSHIDHILISDELLDFRREILTLMLDDCMEDYIDNVSDHRPLMLKLSK